MPYVTGSRSSSTTSNRGCPRPTCRQAPDGRRRLRENSKPRTSESSASLQRIWSLRGCCLKLVMLLVAEHCKKAGKENGSLKAPHRQLASHGISRAAPTIQEAETLGLIKCRRGGLLHGKREPNLYALTWIAVGAGRPTNEWKKITEQDVKRSKS